MTVMGRSARAEVLGIVVGGALLFVGMVGALLLTTELRIEMSAPPWAWAPWLFAFAVLAGLAAVRIRRLIPAYVLEIEPYDVKLRGVHGDVLGSVVDGSLEILPGNHTYLVDKAWNRAVVPALLVVAPGIRFTVHAGRKAPADEAVPPWPFPVPFVDRPRHAVPAAGFEALRWRRTDVARAFPPV